MEMVAPVFLGAGHIEPFLCRKKPLPGQFLSRIFLFFLKYPGHKNPGIPSIQIYLMQPDHFFELPFHFRRNRLRQHNSPILLPFAIMDGQNLMIKIEMADAQFQAYFF